MDKFYYDVVVIGSGPAGISAALTAKAFYPNKTVLIITKSKSQIIPCAMPYVFKTIRLESNVINLDELCKKHGINLSEDTVENIDFNLKEIKGNKDYRYDKLIIATGAKPKKLNIKGIEKKNVFFLVKEYNYLVRLKEAVSKSNKIVIIGAGFAGLELADELVNMNKDVLIIEALEDLLYFAFDSEIRKEIRRLLENKGVRFKFNSKLVEIFGNDKVEGVKLENESIKCDLVIFSIGTVPNVISEELSTNDYGFIKVNEYQETSIKDVFAAGDCAEKIDYFTDKPSKLMLATIACEEGRIAGANLYNKQVKKEKVLPIYSTYIQGKAFACCGMTEQIAKQLNINYIKAGIKTYDRHPSAINDSSLIEGKMIFNEKEEIIGIELYGSKSVGEIINICPLLIKERCTINDLLKMKIATQPHLTSSPISYPIIQAAINAKKELKK